MNLILVFFELVIGTLAVKPNHGLFKHVINNVYEYSIKMFEKGFKVEEFNKDDVLLWSGNRAFGIGFVEYIKNVCGIKFLNWPLRYKSILLCDKDINLLPIYSFTGRDDIDERPLKVVKADDYFKSGRVQHLYWTSWGSQKPFFEHYWSRIRNYFYVAFKC